MSDDLKINLNFPVISRETERAERPGAMAGVAPKSGTLSGDVESRHVHPSRDGSVGSIPTAGGDETRNLVVKGEQSGGSGVNVPPAQSPSLRPSPISGVTPPIATRWKKGCPSPNPGGRPRGLQKAYIKHLATVVDEDTGDTNADKIAKNQISIARSWFDDKSTTAAREIRQATEMDDEAAGRGGFNIGTLNMAILQQITKAATQGELEE